MSLADLAAASPPVKPHAPCTVARIRARLAPADLATFDKWLADSDLYSAAWIARKVRDAIAAGILPQGIPTGEQNISRHRSGSCQCPR